MTITFDKKIEALRGYSAIMVMISHLSGMQWFDNNYTLSLLTYNFVVGGHIYVLVFFLISGYVIGLTYNKGSIDKFDLKTYLKKRFIRIYPIYFVAVFLSILVIKEDYFTVIFNLLFFQNILVNNLTANSPLWTLSHEVLYYLLFAALASLRINPIYALVCSVLISMSCLIYPAMPAIIIALGTGFSYWCVGLIVAWYLPLSNSTEEKSKEFLYIPVLILLLLCNKLNSFYALIPAFQYNTGWGLQFKINIYDWIYFTFCFSAFLVYSNKNFKYLRLLVIISFCSVIASMINSIVKNGFSFYGVEIYVLVVFSLGFLFIPVKSRHITKLSILGSISYALYVIHTPLMYLGNMIMPGAKNLPIYCLKVLVYIVIVVLVSYFLEKYLQPRIKKVLT